MKGLVYGAKEFGFHSKDEEKPLKNDMLRYI